jgi:predicted ATPase
MIIISIDLFKNTEFECYYLPAARSGLLQIHKGLIDKMVKKSSSFEIERPELPRLAGVVSNFISTINNLPNEKTKLYNLVSRFEQEMIRGEIVNRNVEATGSNEIKYIYKNRDIPLHRVSSTVSELAPIILYLKYIIKPGSMLIIEEPEAHLHPANQRILARLLVNLIRRGIKITITTHSPYLLEQLSRFIMLSRIEPDKRITRHRYDKDDFLKPEEVGVYLFKNSKNDMFKIESLNITDEGIPQDEFVKIDEILYEELLKIQRDLNDFAK